MISGVEPESFLNLLNHTKPSKPLSTETRKRATSNLQHLSKKVTVAWCGFEGSRCKHTLNVPHHLGEYGVINHLTSDVELESFLNLLNHLNLPKPS